MRTMASVVLLATAAALLPLPAAAAPAIIPSAFGTPTIDGVMSPGEWSAAPPISVFGNLVGSQLYVMDDNVNLYLGLFVPDGTLTSGDQFWARIDSQNDDVTDLGDDEISVTGVGNFYDSHFTGSSWGYLDSRRDGSGAAAAVSGGNFFEMAHPLNDGDSQDMFVVPGGIIGLCVSYFNDNSGSGLDTYPLFCTTSGASQSGYTDYVISTGTAGVGSGTPAAGARIALRPNPVRRGGELELRFSMPVGAMAMRAGIYAVSGRELARLADGPYPAGEQSVRWTVPAEGAGALSPGIYFVRAGIGGEAARATLVVVQ